MEVMWAVAPESMTQSELAGGCSVIVLKFWSRCCWSNKGGAVELMAGELQGAVPQVGSDGGGGGADMAALYA